MDGCDVSLQGFVCIKNLMFCQVQFGRKTRVYTGLESLHLAQVRRRNALPNLESRFLVYQNIKCRRCGKYQISSKPTSWKPFGLRGVILKPFASAMAFTLFCWARTRIIILLARRF